MMPKLELVCLICRGDIPLLRVKFKEFRMCHPSIHRSRISEVMSGDSQHVFTNKSIMSVVFDLSESSVFLEESE
jgi:hypothetical protein